jgi:hypothetical protein
MTTATSSQLALAQWLIRREMCDAGESPSETESARRACRKFGERLALLVTPAGSEALIARAIHVARTDFPVFDQQRTARTVEVLTQRLRASTNGVESSQARDDLSVVFATLVALVISFIGEDVTMRLLLDVWPELPVLQPIPKASDGTVEVNP